jgi:DHA1 family tetracycline resistance protein-like MFS transporter
LFKRLRGEFSFVSGNVFLLLTVWSITDFAFWLPDSYYSLYVEALGASAQLLGVIVATSSLVVAFLQFAGGYWADRYGRKLLILGASFGKALTYLIFAVAPSWHFILLGEVLIGMTTIYLPAAGAMFADSLPEEKRGLGYSVSLAVGATTILSPVVAGFLYLNYNLIGAMRIVYVLVSILWFISGVIFTRLIETSQDKSRVSLKEAVKQYPTAVKECVKVWKCLPKSMLMLFLIFSPATFFVRMCAPYYVLYANHVLNVGEFQWALLQLGYFLVYYALLLPIGKLVDVSGRKKALMLSSILFAVGMALFITGDILRLYVFFAFSAAGNALVFTAYPSLQADLTPKEHRGKVIGFSNFADSILASVAVLLGGFVYQNFSPSAPFFLLLGVMAITVMATFLFIKEQKSS